MDYRFTMTRRLTAVALFLLALLLVLFFLLGLYLGRNWDNPDDKNSVGAIVAPALNAPKPLLDGSAAQVQVKPPSP